MWSTRTSEVYLSSVFEWCVLKFTYLCLNKQVWIEKICFPSFLINTTFKPFSRDCVLCVPKLAFVTLWHDSVKCCAYSLYWLLSCVDHPVHGQVMGALEGSSTILTDVVPLIWKSGTKQNAFFAFIIKTQIHIRHCASLNTVYVNTCSWTSPVWCFAWRNSCFCRRNKRPHDGWSHTYFFFSKCWYFIWCCNNDRELVQGTHFSYSKHIIGFLIWPVYIVELILLLLPILRLRLWKYLGLSWLQCAGWQTWR